MEIIPYFYIIHLTLGNLSPTEVSTVEVQFSSGQMRQIKAEILTGEMNAHNTFREPEIVKTQDFTDYTITKDGYVILTLPPCSVMHMEAK